jgi:hypothetical protein
MSEMDGYVDEPLVHSCRKTRRKDTTGMTLISMGVQPIIKEYDVRFRIGSN